MKRLTQYLAEQNSQYAQYDDSADDEGMIIYVGDQKFEYSDYTLSDAMNVVDEYADSEAGEEYKIYNAEGKLVASGTVGDPQQMETGPAGPNVKQSGELVSGCCSAGLNPTPNKVGDPGKCSSCGLTSHAVMTEGQIKHNTGSNINMQDSNMGGMSIQNLRKNAGLSLDPLKETNDQQGEYYNDDLRGTIEWEIVDVDRGFGSEGQDFFATITTEDGVTRELDERELEDAEEHVRDDMQGAHDDAGDAAQHAHSDELSILKRNAGI